jgi:Holliday junction resolvase
MPNRTKIGQRGEHRAARHLRRKGFEVKLSPGSRGPADLNASKPRRRWLVQVKASQEAKPAWPSPKDTARLERAAARTGGTAVVAQVAGQGEPTYRSAKTRRKLKP